GGVGWGRSARGRVGGRGGGGGRARFCCGGPPPPPPRSRGARAGRGGGGRGGRPARRGGVWLDGDDFRLLLERCLRGGLQVPDARRVQPEDLRLQLVGEFRIAVALDELVGDLELPERVDLPLRVAPQERIGAPHHV